MNPSPTLFKPEALSSKAAPPWVGGLIVAVTLLGVALLWRHERRGDAPPGAAAVGSVYVNAGLRGPLRKTEAGCPTVWARCEEEGRFVQGYGDAESSSGTHRDGWCLDIATGPMPQWTWHGEVTRPPLPNRDVIRLVAALETAGFAAPLRVEGFNLGNGFTVEPGGEHPHAVFINHANYAACRRSTRPGGRADLSRMLERRVQRGSKWH